MWDKSGHGQSACHSPLGVENSVEDGAPPISTLHGEDSLQVVEGDVALGDGTNQTSLLKRCPLLLQCPGSPLVALMVRSKIKLAQQEKLDHPQTFESQIYWTQC